MLKDKKFTIPCLAEWIMPWLVLIPGIPAFYYFDQAGQLWRKYGDGSEYQQAHEQFETFYDAAMTTGGIAIFLELLLALAGFIWMIISLCKKNKEHFAIIKPLMLWLCPGAFVFGTLLLMLLVHTFTYGMSI